MDDETERRTYISVSIKFWVTFLTASIFTHFLYAFLQELLRVGCKRPLKVEHVNVSNLHQVEKLIKMKYFAVIRWRPFGKSQDFVNSSSATQNWTFVVWMASQSRRRS